MTTVLSTLTPQQQKWIAVGAVSAGAAALLVKALRRLARSRLPGQDVPDAPGRWPLLGHLPLYYRYYTDSSELAHGRMAIDVCAKEGCDVFSVDILGVKYAVVCSPDLVAEVIHGDPDRYTKDFSSAFGSASDFFLMLFGPSGLFFAGTEDRRWGIAHRILKAPFAVRGVKMLFPMMCNQADRLVETLKEKVGYGNACHIDAWVTKMAFETIAVCGLGQTFGSWNSTEEHPFIAALNTMFANTLPLAMVPQSLWPLVLRKTLRETLESREVVERTCLDVIRGRRCQATHAVTEKRDLLDMMLSDTDPKTGEKMTEEMILDNVLTFLFAGQDSTAAAMASCLCMLHANPRCRVKLLQEIDAIVGDGELEWDHLAKLTYLDHCIKEALRLVPPAPSLIRAAKGFQLLGGKYRIDAGTQVMLSVMALHYDERTWGGDALEFRPERWENPPAHKYAYLPFLAGPRACIGREFTLIEQKVTIVKVLQHFDLKRPECVEAEKGYVTAPKATRKYPPFLDMDIETKKVSAFAGIFSAFELHPRVRQCA